MSLVPKLLFGLALVFLLLSAAQQFVPTRQASDLDRFERYAGAEPWAVASIRPGELLTRHESRLGLPERDRPSSSGRTLQWTSPGDLSLTVNQEGEILDVWGRSLSAGKTTLISTGLSQAEVERILGRGKVQTSTQPSGTGVISLGSREIGRTLSYENGGVRFEITLEEDQVKYVRAVKITSER